MSTRVKLLEACVRSRLIFGVQAWELSLSELKKIEVIWHGFLRKMVTNGYRRKNVPDEYLQAKKLNSNPPEPENLDWSYVYSNSDLEKITKTRGISNFCKCQRLKYIAHLSRLPNDSFQKQVLFSTNRKKYARDRWKKLEEELPIATFQLQNLMQNKNEFSSFLDKLYGGTL